MRVAGSARQSAYYWWYQYLKRNVEYKKCCERRGRGPCGSLYKDFGNVHELSFNAWWKATRALFAGPPLVFTLDELKTVRDFQHYEGDRTVLLLVVNLFTAKRDLQRGFNEMLRKTYPRKRGRPAWDDTIAEYPLAARPNLPFLETALKVYDVKQSAPKDKPLWKIAQEAGVGATYRTDKETDPEGRNRSKLAVMASRYLRRAEEMIENAGKGQFPKYT